jgi:hypothetical protein
MNSPWRKSSSYSNQTGGNCVEVATAGAALIRDTTDHGHGPVLRVSAGNVARVHPRHRTNATLD